MKLYEENYIIKGKWVKNFIDSIVEVPLFFVSFFLILVSFIIIIDLFFRK